MTTSLAEWKRRFTPARVGLAVFAAVVLVLGFMQARSKDSYQNIIIPTPTAGTAQTAAGQLLYEDELQDVYPGTYHLEVNYAASGSGSSIAYVDAQTGTVLAGGTLSPENTYWDETITLTHRVNSILMRSYAQGGSLEVDSTYFTSSGPVYTNAWWGLAAVLLLGGVGLWLCRAFRQGRRYGLLLLLAGLAVSLPFASDSLQKGHDLCFHLSRIEGIADGLMNGQFPVRLNDVFLYGGGYLSSVMYPELFLYLPGLLCAGGASILFAYKLFCLFINLATAWAGYAGVRHLFGDKVGFVFSLVYLLNPYRLNDLFIRGAVGEALAMAFLPLAFSGLYLLLCGDRRRGFWLSIVGITAVFQSHLLSTILLIAFGGAAVIFYIAAHFKAYFSDLRRFGALCAAAVSTLLVNLWFIVPFLSYSRWDLNIFNDQRALSSSAIAPFQAFMTNYHYSSDIPGSETTGEMSLTIGLALLLGAALFLLLCLTGRMAKDRQAGGTACLLLGFSAWLMSTNLFPWDALQKFAWINGLFSRLQFAWRFLIAASLLLSVVAALALVTLSEEQHTACVAVMACLFIGMAGVCGAGYLQENAALLLDNTSAWDHNITYNGQYLLTESDEDTVEARFQEGGVLAQAQDVEISSYQKSGVSLSFAFTRTDAAQEITFSLPLYSCAMHRAYLEDGTELALSADENNVLCVTVPAGVSSGTVQVRYYVRLAYRMADCISLLCVLLLAGLAVRRKKIPAEAKS